MVVKQASEAAVAAAADTTCSGYRLQSCLNCPTSRALVVIFDGKKNADRLKHN